MTAIPIPSTSNKPPPVALHLTASSHGPAGESSGWSPRFEACFQANYSRVLAYALQRIGDRTAAEDVAAETFLVAWRRLELMPDDQLPWLLGIARNVLLNERRASRRRERLAARVAAEPAASAGQADAAVHPHSGSVLPTGADADGFNDRVLVALGSLSERDREVLLLTSWDGLDQRRGAAVLGCSVTAFAVRLHRARKRLGRALNLFDDQELS
jgi:RNA polymerase sigma-70 factor, ECF subfamily